MSKAQIYLGPTDTNIYSSNNTEGKASYSIIPASPATVHLTRVRPKVKLVIPRFPKPEYKVYLSVKPFEPPPSSLL